MKKALIFVVVVFYCNVSFTQTTSQQNLVLNFFKQHGVYVLKDYAHPSCRATNVSISASNKNTYFVSIEYPCGDNSYDNFTCTYRIHYKYNDQSEAPYSLQVVTCGSPDSKCFNACEIFSNLDNQTTESDKKRFEDWVGTSLKNMSCKSYTAAKLYYMWNDLGFEEKYQQ